MILLFNPRATSAGNARFPLSVLSLAAVTDGDFEIVDGNLHPDPERRIRELIAARGAPELLAVTVMPGPQLRQALPVCRSLRRDFPGLPVVWGGYFPSLYADTVLRAPYVDGVVRGQGEDTLRELVSALRSGGSLDGIRGLSWKDRGAARHNPERPLRSPSDFPDLPYDRIDARAYLPRSFLGRRTGVHQASIGCPYQCSFCAVPTVLGTRELMEQPARTARTLRRLRDRYGMDGVHFYDNNFFVREDHTRALMDELAPLGLSWWCEARVDALVRYQDSTWSKIKRAGCRMIFFGVESGNDETLAEMKKELTADKALELARRCREWGILPEYSFVLGNPSDPEGDVEEQIGYIREIKRLNPDTEIILYLYTPIPQRKRMFGLVEGRFQYPESLEEWDSDAWYRWATRVDPAVPWAPEPVRRRVREFETVLRARFPTVQDWRLPRAGRRLLAGLAAWRYRAGVYQSPVELKAAMSLLSLRDPKRVSL